MQPHQPPPPRSSNTVDNQEAVWVEIARIAMRGADHPTSLTEDEIRRICQMAIVAMPKRVVMAGCGVAEGYEVPR